MGLSARYKRRPIRTFSQWFMKVNRKLTYSSLKIYTSCSGKASYKFYWHLN